MTAAPPPPPEHQRGTQFPWVIVGVLGMAVVTLTVAVVVLATQEDAAVPGAGPASDASIAPPTTARVETVASVELPTAVPGTPDDEDPIVAPAAEVIEPDVVEVTRFVASGPCVGEELPRLVPASAVQESTVVGDFDGDGTSDRVRVYRDPGISHWMVRSEFGNGYEAEVVANNISGDNVAAMFTTRLGPRDVAVLRLGRSDYFGLFVSSGPCWGVHQSPTDVEITMGDLDGFKCDATGISHTMVKPTDSPGLDFTYSAITYTWNDLLTSLEAGPEVFAAMCCRSPEQDHLIYSSGGFDC